MENFTLETLGQIAIGVVIFVVVSMLLEDGARRSRTIYHFIMSRASSLRRVDSGDMGRSIYQYGNTSMDEHTTAPAISGMNDDLPDMDAEKWVMPRTSRYLTDDEFITFLAAQKLRNGAWRLSANKIVAAAGGDRNYVLGIIRQVRESPATYPERTPEQQQARQNLELDRV